MGGAVERQRRHGDVTRGQRRKIGVVRRHVDLRQPFKSDPEIRIAAAVAALVDLEKAEIALALPRHAYACDILGRTGWEVDVDHGVPGHAGIDHLAQNLRPEFQRGVPLGCVAGLRSEEHTSELQSRQYLVCRLLLEKKNKYIDKCACVRDNTVYV